MSKRYWSYAYAFSMLAGTAVGVGLFSLPYITVRVGIWAMLFYFVVLGFFVSLIHIFFGRLALRTPDHKRLPGFALIYLGPWGKRVALASTVTGLMGALLAYLIVGGDFLSSLMAPLLGGSAAIYTWWYFAAGAIVIFSGLKAVANIQLAGIAAFVFILVGIFWKGWGAIEPVNVFAKTGGGGEIFLPYGVILFSLWGLSLVPEAEEMLGKYRSALGKIAAWAVMVPAVIYLLFILLVVGLTGDQTTPSALAGLGLKLGGGFRSWLLVFGLLTTFTSFIALGMTLKKVLWYDLGVKEHLAWAITCFVPLGLYLAGLKSFIHIIAFVGAVMLAIDGTLVLLMYWKILPKRDSLLRRLAVCLLLAVLLGGIGYEVNQLLTPLYL